VFPHGGKQNYLANNPLPPNQTHTTHHFLILSLFSFYRQNPSQSSFSPISYPCTWHRRSRKLEAATKTPPSTCTPRVARPSATFPSTISTPPRRPAASRQAAPPTSCPRRSRLENSPLSRRIIISATTTTRRRRRPHRPPPSLLLPSLPCSSSTRAAARGIPLPRRRFTIRCARPRARSMRMRMRMRKGC